MNFNYLTFSDGAKYALIARNLAEGKGFTTDFSFWSDSLFVTNGIPHLLPYLISLFFKMFGVNDMAVIAFSLFFHILLTVAVFLLGKKLFNRIVGILAATTVLFNFDYINYATSGASETLFAFEIVIGLYLLSFKRLWINAIGFLVIFLMYFTKPQAVIFMAGLMFYWLLRNYDIKKACGYFFGFGFLAIFFDKFIIYPLSFKFTFLNPIIIRGLESILTYSSDNAVSDALRGAPSSMLSTSDIFKKVFYNLYNFYKSLPQILNPYLFAFFVVGIFHKKSRDLKVATLFLVFTTFMVTALTIPFYRYLHPVVPLVYILGISALFNIIHNKYLFSGLVIFFAVLPTLGIIFLDSRFNARIYNLDKPPAHVLLGQKLKSDTNASDLIVTNLDTWGSWYGERKTVWYPLIPNQIVDPITGKIEFDSIYLTSYLIDDQNYYMGPEWHMIFDNPNNPDMWTCEGCREIAKEFTLVDIYTINPEQVYDNKTYKALLFAKNK